MNEIILDPQPDDWDAFISNCPDAVFSHFHGWTEALASIYGLRPFFLAAGCAGRLCGLLPLVLFDPPGAEKRLVSLPYTDAAGIIADTAETARQLLQAALELTAKLDAHHLELRQTGAGAHFSFGKRQEFAHTPHSFKTGLVLDLPPTSEELWSQLDAKVRNQVRKARKCGCSLKMGGVELLGDFYPVFSENMRDLGSPVHARELFAEMVTKLPAHIFTVSIQGTAAAASMVFAKGATLFNPWASSLKRFRPQCPNMLLYWSMLAHGADSGYTRFDFGRSTPGASTCRFKQQWGAKQEPLVWHVFSRRGLRWDPRQESLVDEKWKGQDLEVSRRKGPAIRRWISL